MDRMTGLSKKATYGAQAEMARTLGMAILAGVHPVGATLPNEADLMHRFGVSRTVVREVIKTLTAKGLVVSKTKVGTRILASDHWNMFDADLLSWRADNGFDADFLAHLFEIRLAIEPNAAALAAERRSEDDLVRLHALVTQMAAADHDAISFANVDVDFHLAVANAARNPFMRSIGAVIKTALMHAFRIATPIDAADRAVTAAAHGRIVSAIAAGDPDTAAAAMVTVIKNGLRRRASDPGPA